MDHSVLDLDELKALKLFRSRIKLVNIPSSKLDASINIATWNIRHWVGSSQLTKILGNYSHETPNTEIAAFMLT